jgi:hypothetical protein
MTLETHMKSEREATPKNNNQIKNHYSKPYPNHYPKPKGISQVMNIFIHKYSLVG